MLIKLTCRCGVRILVTKEQANSTVQCRSCLNRIHVPSEKILVDLGALHRDTGLRRLVFAVMAVLVLGAIVSGLLGVSERNKLAAEARGVIDTEKSERFGLQTHINSLAEEDAKQNRPPDQDPAIRKLRANLDAVAALPEDKEELQKSGFKDVREVLEAIDQDYRSEQTKNWLARAQFADLSETLLYGFIIGAGIVFMVVVVISARVSTHRHRIIMYENQTHAKIISR